MTATEATLRLDIDTSDDHLRTSFRVVRPAIVQDSLDTSETDDGGDYGELVLRDALRDLDSARSYRQVKRARARLLRLANVVSNAVLEQIKQVQPPEREAIFESLLVEGLKPSEAIAICEGAFSRVPESVAWAGIIAAYVQSERLSDDESRRFTDLLLKMTSHPSARVRVAAVESLGRIADTRPEAVSALKRIASEGSCHLSAREAEQALDELD